MNSRPRVLLPIHLDRWTNPIASKLRECAIRIEEIDFFSFSSPRSEEDRTESRGLWARSNLHQIGYHQLLLFPFDSVHHASSTPANLIATFAARARGLGRTTHIFTASVEVHMQDRFYLYYLLSLRSADIVVAVSETVARSVQQHTGRAVVGVVPNGVDLEFFSPAEAGPRPGLVEGLGQYVLTVGALLPRKRPDVVLELAQINPDVKFVLVGRQAGDQGGDAFVRRAQEISNVIYFGEQPKHIVRDLMAHAALMIFPSEVEGQPNVVLEASAMGLPILVQPATSMPEIVEQNVNGWLLPIEPLEAWSVKVREVLGWDSNEKHQFAGRARAYAEEHFSWEVGVERLRKIYLGTDGP